MKKKIVGFFAKQVLSVPIERPQDIQHPGAGRLIIENEKEITVMHLQ